MSISGCTGKKQYLTYRHAANDAHAIRLRQDNAHSIVYRCRACQAWHVGESTGRDKVERRPLRWLRDDEGLDTV